MKQLALFGGETDAQPVVKKTRKGIFEDYDGFVEKFKPKKTTDDCYTPPVVYDAVLKWLGEQVDLSGREIKRPFYPGGNYKAEDYPKGCVVVDNPPFSIMAEIVKYYTAYNIDFFLFAPTLTLFSSAKSVTDSGKDLTYIVCGVAVTYENKANVNTSFMSNLFGDLRIWVCNELYTQVARANEENTKAGAVTLPRYRYPACVVSAALLMKYAKQISLKISKNDAFHITKLDSQKAERKAIFGGGFLISDKAEEAVRKAAEEANAIAWELSERELKIKKSLGK